MKKFYIFKVGQTFKKSIEEIGDFDDWIGYYINPKFSVKVIDILNNEALPSVDDTLGVIITGSHSMVTDNLDWSVNVEQWILNASTKNVPIFGICYGHQLIGKALGGVVQNNPNGKEIGTVEIQTHENIKDDILFKDTPIQFQAHVTHMQSVVTLPKGAKTLAYNSHDENQIVRYSSYIWGVQFHPEFDEMIMKEYIKQQEKELISYGFNIPTLLNEVKATNYSNKLISKFLEIAKNTKV